MRLTNTRDRRSHQMRERRNFSSDFKKQIVESILSGSATQAELAREHRISPVMIGRWKKEYKTGRFFENVTSQDMAKLELRIRDLQRLVGRLTLENEMLKKIRDLNTKEKKESSSIVTSRDWEQRKSGAK
ncbi:MAG: transposase [Actinomycetota bacterium]|nr:transposase [Actinomycetota bacterium]